MSILINGVNNKKLFLISQLGLSILLPSLFIIKKYISYIIYAKVVQIQTKKRIMTYPKGSNCSLLCLFITTEHPSYRNSDSMYLRLFAN